jgi:inhibitor of cysteine peptidase
MRRVAAAALLALLTSAACARDEPYRPPVPTDPARPVTVAPGGEFTLILDSNQSTGYQWVLADSASLGSLTLVDSRYVPIPSENNGTGGHELWRFRAGASGEHVVRLVHMQPWDSTTRHDSLRFVIRVR